MNRMNDSDKKPVLSMTAAQRRREKAKIIRAVIEEEEDYERFLKEHGYNQPDH